MLWKKFEELGIPAQVSSGGHINSDAGYVTIWSGGIPGESVNNVAFANIVSTLPSGGALGLEGSSTDSYGTDYAVTSMDFTDPFLLSETDSISFDVAVNGGVPQSFTIDKADVDAALGTADGIVVSGIEMARIIEYKVGGIGLNFSGSANAVSISVDTTIHPEKGSLSNFTFSNVSGNVTPIGVDFLEIDITGSASLDLYILAIENMSRDAVDGGASLGALQKRIELQTEFTAKMMTSIDRGVGRLVDADMNEASTRLKAIQTQQQLAIQSLSIANHNAENVMQLFR
ncbi:hypothetical protein ASD00_26755 [Ensifer sp. Root31]|nr:hypothetical protein ASD00_26755 [Ensifer sp. Root31]